MVNSNYRPGLPPIPVRIAKLPVDRGYPVPWFVLWQDGKPDFRIFDAEKMIRAIRFGLCWICGQALGGNKAFTVGPMCAVNRISSEPPGHRECAVFSAIACPFLSRPHMQRRENDLPVDRSVAGHMIPRNPGVALVWVTKSFERINTTPTRRATVGTTLFRMGEPTVLQCFAEGRPATREEVRASVDSGYPLLLDAARQEGPSSIRLLEKQLVAAEKLLRIA